MNRRSVGDLIPFPRPRSFLLASLICAIALHPLVVNMLHLLLCQPVVTHSLPHPWSEISGINTTVLAIGRTVGVVYFTYVGSLILILHAIDSTDEGA